MPTSKPKRPPHRGRGNAKRTPAERQRDLVDITRWHLEERKTARQIAALINDDVDRPYTLSHVQVHNDIKKILSDLQRDQKKLRDRIIVQDVVMVEVVIREAMQAWQDSRYGLAELKELLHDVITGEGLQLTEDGVIDKHTVEKLTGLAELLAKPGDPRFLRTVLLALRRRADMLGLDAAKRVQLGTMPSDEQAQGVGVEVLEELLGEGPHLITGDIDGSE